jgi:uncharacterized protein YjlB
MQVEKYLLGRGDGIPNSRLPLVLFRDALPASVDGNAACALLKRNRWGGNWLDGVYPFWHFHTHGHEVLACVAGEARIGFGGDTGIVAHLTAGDVCVIPAGVGHKRIEANGGFQVAGGYPPGQEGNIVRPGDMDDAEIDAEIGRLALPRHDPVTGGEDGVVAVWKEAVASGRG